LDKLKQTEIALATAQKAEQEAQQKLKQANEVAQAATKKLQADQAALTVVANNINKLKTEIAGMTKQVRTAANALKKPQADFEAAKKNYESLLADQKQHEKTVNAVEAAIRSAPEKTKKAQTAIAALNPKLTAAQAAYETVNEEWVQKQQLADAVWIALGKQVSFAKTIAPIFNKQCVVCHNSRVARGRLNMESFELIMKGGASGPAVVPGKADESDLYLLIEYGEMPKDADPLAKKEMAIIKKWINTGAKLDTGLSPSAKLYEITPRESQPLPPEQYQVTIPITALAFSPDGKTLAVAGYHEVNLYNPADGKLVRRVTNLAERIYDIEFSSDGSKIAVAAGTPAQTGELKLFDVANGKLLADFVRSSDSQFTVTISQDGEQIAAAGADRVIRVYETATQKPLQKIEQHNEWVMDLEFSPDGSKLASASLDKTARVFDLQSGEAIVSFSGHGKPVHDVAWSDDAKRVYSAGEDRFIRSWDIDEGKEKSKLGGFGNTIFRMSKTKGDLVFTACGDHRARASTVSSGKTVKTYTGHAKPVFAVDYHDASKRVATGSQDGLVKIWNYEDQKNVLTFTAAPGYEQTKTASK